MNDVSSPIFLSIPKLYRKVCPNFIRKIIGRSIGWCSRVFTSIDSRYDDRFLSPDVPLTQVVNHDKWREYLYEVANKPGNRILEIGSREVTGESSDRKRFDQAEYVGFDFYPGRNVDVVGDVHQLSTYFLGQPRFDLIYTSACFEHFAMPWIVAVEIAKLLKIGGLVFVETHFSYGSHERPWNFFQFSDMGLRVLFSPALGFECIEAGMSNPMVGRFSSMASPYLKNQSIYGLYCHSEYFGRKTKDVPDFDWKAMDLRNVAAETTYPEPKTSLE